MPCLQLLWWLEVPLGNSEGLFHSSGLNCGESRSVSRTKRRSSGTIDCKAVNTAHRLEEHPTVCLCCQTPTKPLTFRVWTSALSNSARILTSRQSELFPLLIIKHNPSYSLWLFPYCSMGSLGGESGGKNDEGRWFTYPLASCYSRGRGK